MDNQQKAAYVKISTLEKAVTESKGKDPQLFYQLGCMYLETKRYQAAVKTFRHYISLTDNFDARFHLAKAEKACGFLGPALQNLEICLQKSSGEYKAYTLQGDIYILQNNIDNAIGSFQKVCEINPGNREAQYKLGRLYWKQGNYKKAIALFKKIIQHPDYMKQGLFLTAMCYTAERDWDKAEGILLELAKTEKTAWQIPALLGYIYRIKSDFTRAQTCLGQAEVISEKNLAVLLQKAHLYFQNNQIDKAEKYYQTILSLRSNHIESLYAMGLLTEYKGEIDQAIAAYQKVLKYQPLFGPAWFALGLIYEQQAQWNKAVDMYNRAMELDNPHASIRLGVFYCKFKKEFNKAVTCFNKAEEAGFKDNLLLFYKGLACYFLEMYETAVELWSLLLRKFPDNIHLKNNLKNAYYRLGELSMKNDDYHMSIQCWETMATRFGWDGGVKENLAEVLFRKGKLIFIGSLQGVLTDALKCLEKAAGLCTGRNHYRAWAYIALIRNQTPVKKKEQLKKLEESKIFIQDPLWIYYLSVEYINCGEWKKAGSYLQSILKKEKKNPPGIFFAYIYSLQKEQGSGSVRKPWEKYISEFPDKEILVAKENTNTDAVISGQMTWVKQIQKIITLKHENNNKESIKLLTLLLNKNQQKTQIIHLLAIMHHNYALELEDKETSDKSVHTQWQKAFEYWAKIWTNKPFWDELYIKLIKYDYKITKEIINQMRQTLPLILFDINKQYIMQYKDFDEPDKAQLHINYIKRSPFLDYVKQEFIHKMISPFLEEAKTLRDSSRINEGLEYLRIWIKIIPGNAELNEIYQNLLYMKMMAGK